MFWSGIRRTRAPSEEKPAHGKPERRSRRPGPARIPARVRHRPGVRHRAARPRRGRRPAHLAQERGARISRRVAPEGVSPLAHHDGAPLGERHSRPDRLRRDLVLLRPEVEGGRSEEPRRGRSQAPRDLREARNSARGARRARGRRGRRGLRQRLRRHHLQGQAGRAGHRLLLVLRSGARAPGARGAVPRHRGPVHRQLLRLAQLRGLQRRLVLLHPQGRALPDGAVHLLPDQRGKDRPVRTHPRRRGRGELRELPGGVHRPGARREPAPRRGGRAGRAGRRGDQVLDGAELVPGRRARRRRHLQLRHQARGLPGRPVEDLVDPGRDRLGHHLEVPELHPARRRLGGRVLLRGASATCASRRTPARR